MKFIKRSLSGLQELCFLLLFTLTLQKEEHLYRSRVNRPPTISVHPPYESTFKNTEEVEIPCEATGTPPLRFQWLKDGEPLEKPEAEIHMKEDDQGTVVLYNNEFKDEGYYQCIVRNKYGTAASVKTLLKMAVQESFPTVKEPQVLNVRVGENLTLRCNPPKSYPTPDVYWGTVRKSAKLLPLENTMRYNLDYEGNLHFSNVMPNDSLVEEERYTCAVHTPVIRSIVQGGDTKIKVFGTVGNFHFTNVMEEDHRDGAYYTCISHNNAMRSSVQGNDCVIRVNGSLSGWN